MGAVRARPEQTCVTWHDSLYSTYVDAWHVGESAGAVWGRPGQIFGLFPIVIQEISPNGITQPCVEGGGGMYKCAFVSSLAVRGWGAVWRVLQCAAVCCSVLQCVAVCCSVLQCVAVCCSVCGSVLKCVAVCCSVMLCFTGCCSVLQCVVVFCYDVSDVLASGGRRNVLRASGELWSNLI